MMANGLPRSRGELGRVEGAGSGKKVVGGRNRRIFFFITGVYGSSYWAV